MASGQDPNRAVWYMPVGWVCTILALIAVSLRLYTRAFLTRSIGSDDFAMILPLVSTVGGQIVDTMSNLEGYGRHAKFLSTQSVETITKHTYIAWIRAFISYFFLRASIMLFTLRLLPCTKKWARRTIYVAFFLNFAITLIACVCYGIRCTPFRASWTTVPGSSCKSETLLVASQTVNGVLSCIIDITTALIPAFLLWDLQMQRRTKVFLDIIFLLGLGTAALSIARAVTTKSGTYADDLTYASVIPGAMSAVEEKMGIFFASCPMLRQFVTYTLRTKTLLPSSTRSPPNTDFVAMRKRVKLRDIFWYRKATPNDVTPSPTSKPNQPRHISEADTEVQWSSMDRIWRALGLSRWLGSQTSHGQGNRYRSEARSSEQGLVVRKSVSVSNEWDSSGTQGSSSKAHGRKHYPETFLLSRTRGSNTAEWATGTTSTAESV